MSQDPKYSMYYNVKDFAKWKQRQKIERLREEKKRFGDAFTEHVERAVKDR